MPQALKDSLKCEQAEDGIFLIVLPDIFKSMEILQ